MDKPYTVRNAELGDVPGIIQCLKDTGLWYDTDDTPEKLQRKIRLDHRLTFVGTDANGRIVGFVMGSYDGWSAIIWHLAVHPDFRHTTLVLALLRPLMRQLKREGADIVYGFVSDRNERMLSPRKLFTLVPDLGVRVVYRTI